MTVAQQYASRGFGGRQGTGERPCLLVIDLNNAFTDPASPLHCDTDHAVDTVAALLEAARSAGTPIVFTTIAYDDAAAQAAAMFIAKAPALASVRPGSHWAQIDQRIRPMPGEPVLCKLFASAFFGTPLMSMLTRWSCDTIAVTGASTSGCVRATVVDALQHGFRVVVPRDGIADRDPAVHEASLLDIDAKYADVVDTELALDVLGRTS